MVQFKGSIPLIVAIISLKSLNSCGNKVTIQKESSFEKTSKIGQMQTEEDTLFLSSKEYKVILSNEPILDIEITNQQKISLIKSIKYSVIMFEMAGETKLAKENDLFSSSIPKNCDYFYPINKGSIVFINNKLSLRKVSKKDY